MRILLVADGRSPITRAWVANLLNLKHEIVLVSTFPCAPLENLPHMLVMPVAFGALSGGQVSTGAHTGQARTGIRREVGRFRSALMGSRYLLGPLTLPFFKERFQRLVNGLQPDLVHALRIPFEGMLAAYTPQPYPLAVSIWGNDLTYHAHGSAQMSALTRRVLKRADGLLADAQRDIRLGRDWGFDPQKPTLVVPGGGGVDLYELHRPLPQAPDWAKELPTDIPLLVNPRGFRPGSVRNDTFFRAIPLVLEREPRVMFACAAMQDQKEAMDWVEKLKLKDHVRLLPYLPQPQLWDLFRRAQASISVSEHDGTPNSLLEAMAIGCLPIAGDIESIREWITPGVNGLLVEPSSPQSLAEAILLALANPGLRASAAEKNLEIIRRRAEINTVRASTAVFYQQLANR
jgi:glycosyltransferase involved in cell wall biosynthesis